MTDISYIHRIFGEDYRIVVGEGDALAAQFLGAVRDGFRAGLVDEFVEAARFGNVPVLTKFTGEVASGRAERQDAATGIEMV